MKKFNLSLFLAMILVVAVVVGALSFSFGGSIESSAEVSYYYQVTATSGNELLGQLHDLITKTHTHYTTYSDCSNPNYVKNSDPGSKASKVMEFYSGADINAEWNPKSGGWNREHVWCQSLSNGLWGTTGGGSDLYHIRPVECALNSTRNNNKYGNTSHTGPVYYKDANKQKVALGGYLNNGVFEPIDEVKGDVARILFYIYTHYNTATNVYGTTNGPASSSFFGDLQFTNVVSATSEAKAIQMLLEWNRNDPVSDIEVERNNYVQTVQGNRNPFVDNMSYADAIWGNGTVTYSLQKLTLSPQTVSLAVGATTTFELLSTPVDGNKSVTWSSSNPSVARVSETGVVTAIADGYTTIIAKSNIVNGIKATANVLVGTAGDWGDDNSSSGGGTTGGEQNPSDEPVEGISKITVGEIANFTNSYDFYDWSDGKGLGGIVYAYKNGVMQFNNTRTYAYFASNNIPNGSFIRSVTITLQSGAERKWTLYTSDTPFTAECSSISSLQGVVSQGQQTVTSSGTTWNIEGTPNKYFALVYDVKANTTTGTGACLIKEISVNYGPICDHSAENYAFVNEKDANCHETGYTGDIICLDCHQIIVEGEVIAINPDNHTNLDLINEQPATCHTFEYSGDMVCLDCDEIIIDGSYGFSYDFSNHDGEQVTRNTVTATCCDYGYTGDVYCLGCNTVLTSGQSIAKDSSNHVGGTKLQNVVTATCTVNGYTGDVVCNGCLAVLSYGNTIVAANHTGGSATCCSLAVCSVCGVSYGEYDSSRHSGGTKITNQKAATCTVDGYSGDTVCKGCNAKLISGTTIKAVGHSGGTATCTTLAACSECGSLYGEYDAHNHVGGTEITNQVAATCTVNGYTGDKVCKSCRVVLVSGETILASGHKGGTATCCALAVCSICNNQYGSFDFDNHVGDTEVRNIVVANCSNQGYTGDTYCLGCNTVVEYGTFTALNPKNHVGGSEIINVKVATCTVNGYTGDKVCKSCKVVLVSGGTILASGHKGGTATCCALATCSVCNQQYGSVDLSNHVGDVVISNTKAATCEENGYSGDEVCNGCNTVLNRGESIPALGHQGGSANCVSKAVCSICGNQYGSLNPNVHVGGTKLVNVVEKTCTVNGYTGDKVCNSCENVLISGSIIPASGHTGGTATCHTQKVCEVCGVGYGLFDCNNHDGETQLVNQRAATCMVNGYTGDTICGGCGEVLSQGENIVATGHTGGTATCCSLAECEKCGAEYGELNSQNHAGGEKVKNKVEVTCLQNGYSGDTVCNGCGVILQRGTVILASGHKGGIATCCKLAICDVCYEYYGEYDFNNHKGERVLQGEKLPTCVDDGYTGDLVCSGCRTVFEAGEVVGAVGHKGGIATCVETGVCEVCAYEYLPIDPNNHVGGTTVVNQCEVSCLVDGNTGDILCNGCGNTIEFGVITPATGHKGGTATCCSPAICMYCDEPYGEKDNNNHVGGTKLDGVTAVSCTQDGYTGNEICLGCNQILLVGEVVASQGHQGGTATCCSLAICTVCGSEYGEFDAENHQGNPIKINEKAVACGVDGYTGDIVCSGCQYVYIKGDVIKAQAHSGGTATCCSLAVCELCDSEYGDYDYNNHTGNLTICNAAQVTCTVNGYTGDEVCDACGKVVNAGEIIPSQGHKGGTATCCSLAVCTVCGNTYGELDANNHQGSPIRINEKAVACGVDGYTGDVVCSGCNYVYIKGEVIKAQAHSGGTATCCSLAVCELCGAQYGDYNEYNHKGGTEIQNVVELTCTQNGNTGDTVCLGCGTILIHGQVTVATGHKGGNANCHQKAICEVCNSEYGDYNLDVHEGGQKVINQQDSTCVLDGYTGDIVCKGCESILQAGEVVKALGHTGGVATCNTKAQCEICGEFYGEFDLGNHNSNLIKQNQQDATCVLGGYTGDDVCPDCGTIIKQGKVIAALGHTGGTATCCSLAVCTVCANEYGELDATNHVGDTEIANQVEVSCVIDGYTGDVICTSCKNIISKGSVVESQGHQGGVATCCTKAICSICLVAYGDFDNSNHSGHSIIKDKVDATCVQTGYSGDVYCSGCDKIISYGSITPINVDNHSDQRIVVDYRLPTCTEDGYSGDICCERCKNVLSSGYVLLAEGHQGGTATCCSLAICSICGDEYGEYDFDNHQGEQEIQNVVEPSCVEDGNSGDTVCSGCGSILVKGNVLKALGHKGGFANCIMGAVCEVCGDEYGDIDVNNHVGEIETYNQKQSTCCEKGYSGDKCCSKCRNVVEAGYELDYDSNNHIHGLQLLYVKEPNCIEQGYSGDEFCSDCGEVVNQGQVLSIDPNNHVGDTELRNITVATCSTQGYSGDLCCLSCGAVVCSGVNTEIDNQNHVGESYLANEKESSCFEDGYSGDLCCESCGAIIEKGEVVTGGHHFNYTMDGGIIVERCLGDCGHAAICKLLANNCIYDKNPQGVVVESDGFVGAIGEVYYFGIGLTNYEKSTDKPCDVGTYRVIVNVVDFELTATFAINKAKVVMPTPNNTLYVFDGTEQTYNVQPSEFYNVLGNKRTDAGTQTVIVRLADKNNYEWSDCTTKDLVFYFVIAKAKQVMPKITAKNVSVCGAVDGSVDGLSVDMQYRVDGNTEYTQVVDVDQKFAEGKYYFRLAELDNYAASVEIVVLIGHDNHSEGSEWILQSVPTTKNTGLKYKVCQVCGDRASEVVIPKLTTDDGEDSVTDEGSGVVEKEVVNYKNTPALSINNNINDLREKLFTKEDEQRIANGEKASIYIEIKTYDDKITKKEMDLIANVASGKTSYFDLSLFKCIGEDDPLAIANSGVSIKMTMNLPNQFTNKNGEYKLVRVHDGIAIVMDAKFDLYNKTVSFDSNKFSTYAIVFVEATPNTISGAVIAGIVIGCVLGIALIVVIVVIVIKKSKKSFGNIFSK